MAANGAAAIAAECEFRDEHPQIQADLEHLKADIERVDRGRLGNEERLFVRMDLFGQRLSALEARVLVLVTLVGPVLTAIVLMVAKRFGVG